MAGYVSSQEVRGTLSPPSKGAKGRVRRVEWWPAGGGLISRLSVPVLSRSPRAVQAHEGGGGAGLSWRGGVWVGAVELGRAGGEGAPPDAA